MYTYASMEGPSLSSIFSVKAESQHRKDRLHGYVRMLKNIYKFVMMMVMMLMILMMMMVMSLFHAYGIFALSVEAEVVLGTYVPPVILAHYPS